MFLHDVQKLDNHFRARSDQHLTLSSFLGVIYAFQRIVQDGSFDHFGCGRERG
jgi:hypothetical protein